ncbi:hypothetical protein ACI784_24640 [Geodermatophilus sp. SYSU D01186]
MTTRHSTDDSSRPRPCGPLRTPGAGLVEQLRQAAVYAEAAAVLERRAGRAANPALAALLRERAEARRRMGQRLRAALAEQSSHPLAGRERP